MKTERNILIAFILNLAFSVFEFFGGILTGSVAIISDSVHDLGDAVSIGISYFFERKSKREADERYTYGYIRYSVMGGFVTTLILLLGSVAVIYNAVLRLITPAEINYNGMIIFAVVGVCVNLCAALFTRDGESVNQRAVNLHMLEDVLGWLVVLIGAVTMRFTDFAVIDPIMSIGVSAFILVNAFKNLKMVAGLFLEKTPDDVDISELCEHILHIEGIEDVHHLHVWSMDGASHCATMHIVTDDDHHRIKEQVRYELCEHGIAHATIEIETSAERCHARECHIETGHSHHGHHHHH